MTNPIFLICLIAVGIPIAIHLLQLRRYRKVYFSNTDMLEQLQSESRRQHNLRRWLLLAARILAIVFLVLAFCQPIIRNKRSQMQAGGSAVSVYLDNSFSMECGGMEGSLIESARQKAREIAEAYKPDDIFQLVTNDADGSQFRWLSREEFLSAVDAVQISPVTQQLSDVVKRQYDFLHETSSANRHHYVISDFQRATADLVNIPSDSLIHTTLVPMGGSDVSNIYIDSLAFNSPAYTPGATVRVEVFVRNDGDKSVERLPLRLYVGDKQRALTAVDVAAHSSAVAEMTFSIGQEPSLQGYVETTDYPITFDDKFYFSLSTSLSIPTLVISGGAENIYLRRLFADDTLVRYQQVSSGQIDYSQLASHRFIILDELRTIPSGLAQTLRDYVADGGSLLVVPPADADVEGYNRMLGTMQAPSLGSWVSRRGRASRVQTDNELYRDVFKGGVSEMELPSAEGYYRLLSAASTVSVGLIDMPDAASLLSGTDFSNGRIYLFAMPLRPEHTDLVQQALFVPTLYNMALHSALSSSPYHWLTASEPVMLCGSYDAERPPHLSALDGSFDLIPDIRRAGPRSCWVPHGDIPVAGNYRLHDDDGSEGLSLNYSRQESDLSFLSLAEMRKLASLSPSQQFAVAPSSARSMTDYIQQQGQGRPLWRLFVILALLALLAEIILARQIEQ